MKSTFTESYSAFQLDDLQVKVDALKSLKGQTTAAHYALRPGIVDNVLMSEL